MTKALEYGELVEHVDSLPLADKLRLMEHLAPRIAREVRAKGPRVSLRGLWKDTKVSESDIDEVRREMWSNFPREDF